MAEEGAARIRRFRTGDIGQILEIEAQAFPKTAYPRDIFLSYAGALPDGFMVLEKGSNIVGYIIYDTEDGHVHSTAVGSHWRRKGFGRMLFRHAEGNAKKRLWLEVRTRNHGAIAFYRKMGMKVVGKVSQYYGTDDALIMAATTQR
jgi:ribosomal-protein-alanine acetyltransferase